MTIRSNFSDTGLDVGLNANNMTYLYGLSDFFAVMFQDTSTVNLLLEAETEVASEIYSRFLQFTSSISLAGIQDVTNSSIKLVYLTSSDLVSGKANTYRLPEDIRYSQYIANRAFLPTELLDSDVDFRITRDEDGTSYVQFAKPLTSYALPSRLLSDGVTEQYALWFVDAEIDEQLVSKYYGGLIAINPENASSQFSDFVYGLFYVYMNGPKLDTLSRGLNLVLGIPVSRATEQVISIRNYLETDQYIVICDQNQYVIPYGLAPSVAEGDILELGQPLAQWVEIKDYEHDGEWWINLHIPEKLVPQVPAGQKDRYATKGSHFDYLMRNYLKTHTFMVKVKVADFKNIQKFSQISDIIKRAKPTYTEAVYVWTLDSNESITMQDIFSHRFDGSWDDGFRPCISRLRRDNNDDPILRGHRSFIRYNVDHKITSICGDSDYANVYETAVGSDMISGYVNPISQFRENTDIEKGWIRAVLHRGHSSHRGSRDRMGFHRSSANPSDIDGFPVRLDDTIWRVDLSYKMIPLYTATVKELSEKMSSVGLSVPGTNDWQFEIFSTRAYAEAINDISINYLPPDYDPQAIIANYDLFFHRNPSNGYLGREFGPNSEFQYYPKVSEVVAGDYLLCIRITDTVAGVYWITSSNKVNAPAYFPVGEIDPLLVTYDMPLSRGGGLSGAPFYVLRGAGLLDYNNTDAAINSVAINEHEGSSDIVNPVQYVDKYNTVAIPLDRSGRRIIHALELT